VRAYARNVPRTLCDRQLKKSTKQTDRAKALEVCLALERAEGMTARGTLTETKRGIPSGGIPDYLVNAIVAQLVDRLIRNCLTCFCVDFRNIAQPVFQGQL
jgi:hypothetical protein